MAAARTTLAALGAVTDDGTVTDRGRAIARIGADPRLARALLDGAALVGARRAAEIVAMISEDVRVRDGDLVAALRSLRRGATRGRELGCPGPAAAGRPAPDRPLRDGEKGIADDLAVGFVVALAHPDRIARLRPGSSAYLMASGTGAAFPAGASSLAGLPWVAVADADRRPGQRDATVRSAAPLTEDLALEAAPALWHEEEEVRWTDGRVVAELKTRLGAIELASSTLVNPAPALVAAAVREGLRLEGLGRAALDRRGHGLRRRMDFLHRALGEPWPDVSDEALTAGIESWLGPELSRIRGTRDLGGSTSWRRCVGLLPWPEAGRLAELAPERVEVPSGSRVRIDYAADQPVLAVRLQEVFGWEAAPALAGGRVPLLLHLLSPARRPAAVTADLRSFWRSGYPQVRAELRGSLSPARLARGPVRRPGRLAGPPPRQASSAVVTRGRVCVRASSFQSGSASVARSMTADASVDQGSSIVRTDACHGVRERTEQRHQHVVERPLAVGVGVAEEEQGGARRSGDHAPGERHVPVDEAEAVLHGHRPGERRGDPGHLREALVG
jgi:ATP-dependent helicase HrpB